MSCPKATAPINISNNTSNTCDLKCEYSFEYKTTDLVGSNKGEYMSFIPNAQEPPPVTFNADKYVVSEMRLYQPSLHTFGGMKASGEIVIIHTNVTGKGTLLVCVPIKTGTTIDNAATTLDTLVAQVAKLAPISGSSAGTINLPTFTFGQLVPEKPYYNYVGTLPYSPCNGEYQYIVFPLDNAIQPLKHYPLLSQIILIQPKNVQEPYTTIRMVPLKMSVEIYTSNVNPLVLMERC